MESAEGGTPGEEVVVFLTRADDLLGWALSHYTGKMLGVIVCMKQFCLQRIVARNGSVSVPFSLETMCYAIVFLFSLDGF